MADEQKPDGDEAAKLPEKEAEKAAKPAKATKPQPASLTLASVYGFIDEKAGEVFHWIEGQVETDSAKIKLLIERQAPVKETP